MRGKMIGFKAEAGLARALEELIPTEQTALSVSALLRNLARKYVIEQEHRLSSDTRYQLGRDRVHSRASYRRHRGSPQ